MADLHLLTRASFPGFLDRPETYAASPVPSLEDWNTLWASWDAVTLGMIQDEDLLSKPINLRNALVFYIGHIPTFLDIHLTRATNEAPTEPSHYAQIFERGIDPDVDNPERCHSHSEIPDSWPPVKEIRQFQGRVRERVKSLYTTGDASSNMRIGRALWLGLEHEIMHLETLLYMLLQSEKTLPPPGTVCPHFEGLARTADRTAVPNQWINIPESTLKVGLDDPDVNKGPFRYFGWDNEKPPRMVQVPAVVSKARPITNEEYLQYLQAEGVKSIPASWITAYKNSGAALTNGVDEPPTSNGIPNGIATTNGNPNGHTKTDDFALRTVYGPVPLKHALHWPVMASYDELAGCALWMGGRIPTADELRSIYSHADGIKTLEANRVLAKRISAVNGFGLPSFRPALNT
jgi:formylglycine-generating enzyme required for sulfatase activity